MNHLVGSYNSKKEIAKNSGWTKSPTREFFFDILNLISNANDEFQKTNHLAPVEMVFDVGYFMREIPKVMMSHASGNGKTPIIWKTTPTRMNRHLGQVALVDMRDTFIPPTIAVSVNQQTPFHAFHLSADDVKQLKTYSKKDNFGMYVVASGGSSTGLGIFCFRLLMFNLEEFLRNNKGSLKGYDPKALLKETRLGNNFLPFDVFFDDQNGVDNFFKNHILKVYFKNKNIKEKKCWVLNDQIFQKNVGFNVFFQDKRNAWSDLLNATEEQWANTEAGCIPGENPENKMLIAPFYNKGDDANVQEVCCLHGDWKGALEIFTKSGTITRPFVSRLIEARRVWQVVRKGYCMDRNLTYEEAWKKVHVFVPRYHVQPPITKLEEIIQSMFSMQQ